MKKASLILALLVLAVVGRAGEEIGQKVDIGYPFGEAKLVDEILCATDKSHAFRQWPETGTTKVENILGQKCLVMPPGATCRYFGYVIGKGKKLKKGGAYVLQVEYPEDQPRSFVQHNDGAATILGMATGATLGDSLFVNYVPRTSELIEFPLSKKYERSQHFFNLHDRSKVFGQMQELGDEGFSVHISQYSAGQDPASAGAAVYRIALYEIADTAKLDAPFVYPPEDLPRRYVFWREEMSDNDANGDEKKGILPIVDNLLDWYKYKVNVMRLLSINTFCKDVLEFGHNQCFNPDKYGGNRWWYTNDKRKNLWQDIVTMVGQDKRLSVLPYYEYGGSIGADKKNSIGSQCRARLPNGEKKYTHVQWSGAPKCNADLADPDFIEDARKLLDCSIVGLKDKANFIGAWFRPRMEQNPISYNEKDLALYAQDTGIKITAKQLLGDQTKDMAYREWFLQKRHDWMLALRDYLRQNANPEAMIYYTTEPSEPGVSVTKDVVCEKKAVWQKLLKQPEVAKRIALDKKFGFQVKEVNSVGSKGIVSRYAAGMTNWRSTWGKWRWDLGCPPSDPQRFKTDSGLGMAYSINRLYSVENMLEIEQFRCKDGLMMVRHYSLNEHNMSAEVNGKNTPLLGYFVVQFDRAGKYSMLMEARALLNGDPRYLGYLAPLSFNKLFPAYARRFYQAFLALPAVPGVRHMDYADQPQVGVREYKTAKHGTYYAVVNAGLKDVKKVKVKLPAEGAVLDLLTGKELPRTGIAITVDLYAGEVLALQVI